jgi:hypothetical protein
VNLPFNCEHVPHLAGLSRCADLRAHQAAEAGVNLHQDLCCLYSASSIAVTHGVLMGSLGDLLVAV